MKKLKKFLIIAVIGLLGCERDDICAETTATTPRLIIEFYDADNPDDLKSVPRLTAYGEGLVTDPENSSNATLVFNANVNKVELPLRIEEENQTITSNFVLERNTNLRLDNDGSTDSNIDTIAISYIPQFEYVSRACGYKSIFVDLSVTANNDGDTWISSVEVVETTINNENTVHVRILH